jgi:excisionase family DNA binding protein
VRRIPQDQSAAAYWTPSNADAEPAAAERPRTRAHQRQDRGDPDDGDEIGHRADAGLLDGYLTEAQVAAQLGVTARTIWRWRKERRGPPVTLFGRRVLFHIDSVRAWLKRREQAMPRDKWRSATSGGRREWNPEDRMRREKRSRITT